MTKEYLENGKNCLKLAHLLLSEGSFPGEYALALAQVQTFLLKTINQYELKIKEMPSVQVHATGGEGRTSPSSPVPSE